jgi:energy-coupling factor transport system substrate-specific component
VKIKKAGSRVYSNQGPAFCLDIVIYSQPAIYVFTQGVIAMITNAISAGVIGSLLLLVYSKTRSKKGGLSQED